MNYNDLTQTEQPQTQEQEKPKENNSLGLTPEELSEIKRDIQAKKQAKEVKQKRDAKLKQFLEDPQNAEVHKALYNDGGLKSMIQSRPEILDSDIALEFALKESKQKLQQTMKKDEPEVRQTEVNKPLAQTNQHANDRVDNNNTDFLGSMDIFKPENLAKFDKNTQLFLKANAPRPGRIWEQ